jgi:N-acetylmuramoyl-L-alanine amidase
VKYRNHEIDTMARMLRAEAEAEGDQGMLFVANVAVNRAKVKCLDFKDVNTVTQVIYQIQGGNYSFECVQKGYFYQRAREHEKRLAKKAMDYWREYPAKYSLWYFNPAGPTEQACPTTWYNQPLVSKYKNHCFYEPKECEDVYIGS